MPALTLVVGGTGKTGRRVVERLKARGVPVRVGVLLSGRGEEAQAAERAVQASGASPWRRSRRTGTRAGSTSSPARGC